MKDLLRRTRGAGCKERPRAVGAAGAMDHDHRRIADMTNSTRTTTGGRVPKVTPRRVQGWWAEEPATFEQVHDRLVELERTLCFAASETWWENTPECQEPGCGATAEVRR